MKILIASATYYPGNNGQASFTIRLCEGLTNDGHQVCVLVPADTLQSYSLNLNGVQVERIGSFHAQWLHPETHITPFPFGVVNRVMDEFRPDIVHIQDHYPICISVTWAARRRKLPLLGTNHFLPENLQYKLRFLPLPTKTIHDLLWQSMLVTYNLLDHVTTPTATAAEILRAQKIRVPVTPISCGVDTRRFYPIPDLDCAQVRRKYGIDPDRAILLYIGRHDREKRLDLLLNAANQLDRDDYQMVFIGSGAFAGALRRMASHYHLEKKAIFLGFLPSEHLVPILNCADLFIMPSPEELQSIASLEAMACAKPVLAARARALPELVHDGINGALFNPNDAGDLAYQINHLLDRRQDWAKMGAASRKIAETHDIQNTVHKYVALYQEVIQQKKAG